MQEMHAEKKSANGKVDSSIPTTRSNPRINTVVDFSGSSESGEEDDRSDISQAGSLPQHGISGPLATNSPSATGKSNKIAIELNVSTSPNGLDGVTVVNPKRYDSNFLTGPATLLTKSDIMYMIQEGVRLAISQKANNNRVRQIRQGQPTRRSLISMAANMSAESVTGTSGRKMKYILHQYKPKNFQMIRRLNGISSEDFIHSICDAELLGGYTESSGKSGSLFWCSSDQKYIMKSISQEEARLMNSICSSYLRYIGSHPHSLLCKFLGMYKVVTTVAQPSYLYGGKRASRVRSQIVHTTRFVIMNNVFAGCPDSANLEKFDLKGTTEDRYVRQMTGKEVLKDLNFSTRWITLPESLAECFTRVIKEDCEFLFKHGLMDYSLIVGVSRPVPSKSAPYVPSSGSNDPPVLSSTGPARDIWDQLTSNSWEDQVAQSFQQNSRKTLGDKFNQQLLAAKTAAVKAAHSMQRLLTPSKDVSDNPPHQQSRLSSIEEHESVIPNEDSPVNKKKRIQSRRSSAEEIERCNTSVFTSFQGGVAGIDETRAQPLIYYFGIIDMLQQYTVKKKMAHFIKKFTIGCCHEIDTVAPSYYQRRFEKYTVGKIHALEPEEIEKIRSSHGTINARFSPDGIGFP